MSPDPSPSAQAVSREEETILWRALERIPETYREPLILFYREQQSVERVAAALELSEDAVKQRLARGRKLLEEEVTAFVEGALRRSGPRDSFSEGVVAMLPSTPVAAAKVGALRWLSAPIVGIAGGMFSHWLIARNAPWEEELRAKGEAFIGLWIFVLASCIWGQAALRAWGRTCCEEPSDAVRCDGRILVVLRKGHRNVVHGDVLALHRAPEVEGFWKDAVVRHARFQHRRTVFIVLLLDAGPVVEGG